MNIDVTRRKAVWNLYQKGVGKEDLVLVTGFSEATIDKIINSERRSASRQRSDPFEEAWLSVTSLLQKV